MSEPSQPLWIETPLLYSSHISSIIGCSAYLKLENLQPSHSFKYRGVTLFIQHCKHTHGPSVHCIIASGGNAGLAAACAARRLAVRCTVYLPATASPRVVAYLEKEEAHVVIAGAIYAEALAEARKAAEEDEKAVMVPAYDDPLLWEGHSSMVAEIAGQLPGGKPDAIVCSVGGGGLLAGIIVGCKKAGWDDVPLVTLETHGTSCFRQSMDINARKNGSVGTGQAVPSTAHPGITLANVQSTLHLSKASCLGASTPSAGAVKLALERQGPVRSLSVPDGMSMDACCRFAEDHKLLVELACSTALTPAYSPSLFSKIFDSPTAPRPKTVVFIVCGGFNISLDEIAEYKRTAKEKEEKAWYGYGTRKEGCWDVVCDGQLWDVPRE